MLCVICNILFKSPLSLTTHLRKKHKLISLCYYDKYLKSSTDGLNWTTETAVMGSYWTSIVYGNGFFVGVSSSGTNRVMTSYSTTTWGLSTTLSKVDSFLRTVTISNVNRDSTTGDIVSSGGALDTGTKLITVNVSWQESGETITKSLPFYISNIFL